MKKYFLNVSYYNYRGDIGGGYTIGEYETLEEAINVFASYTSINDFQTAESDEYVILSIDSDEECDIKTKKFEWEE